ncbi:flavodoxin [Erysipelotrichaceae bacterium RD49]|nr:flavodoxin [Erysipelotrichaceae bacterium RD49]
MSALCSAAFILAGCVSQPSSQSSSFPSATEAESSIGAMQQEAVSTDSSEDKILVAYFSATGNTKRVADEIAQDTDGTLFEISPAKPYTEEDLNFNQEESRVVQEYENPDQRDTPLSTTSVPDWDSYDIVFLGYPLWWQTAAWPIGHFVADNDFSNKTVYPFCTSLSSPIAQTADALEQLTNTGDWKEGRRFSETASSEDVQTWIVSLGLEK